MTDMAQGIGQSSDTVTAASSPPVVAQSASTPAMTSDERTFKQSEVSDIVKRAKQDAVDSFRRMQTEQPQYLEQKYGSTALPQPTQNQTPNNITQTDIRRMAAEEAQRLRDEWVNESTQKSQEADAQRMVQEFWTKVLPGREKYQDFEKVVGDIEYARFPNVVQLLARHVDNSDSVLYDLGKNRMKMSSLEQLATMSPKDAVVEMTRLSQSLKDNEAASKTRLPNEPLSQMRPSNAGTDSGALSVRDLRKKYKV